MTDDLDDITKELPVITCPSVSYTEWASGWMGHHAGVCGYFQNAAAVFSHLLQKLQKLEKKNNYQSL